MSGQNKRKNDDAHAGLIKRRKASVEEDIVMSDSKAVPANGSPSEQDASSEDESESAGNSGSAVEEGSDDSDSDEQLAELSAVESADLATKKHFRFGSEEPMLDFEQVSSDAEAEGSSEGGNSDDEAPEDVSAATALASVRAAAEATARAVKKQRMESKKQSQLKNAQLQAQAQAAKMAQMAAREIDVDSSTGNVDGTSDAPILLESDSEDDEAPAPILALSDISSKVDKKKPAPRLQASTELSEDDDEEPAPLLPAELLEADFDRAVTPTPTDPQTQQLMAHKKINKLHVAPRDRQIGPVKVRVLEKQSKVLAQKANPSKDRREHWLQGRIGAKGRFERKAMNTGFTSTRASR